MRKAIALVGLGIAAPASAQTIVLKPLVDARLRYESVDQADLPRDSHALTARIRSGLSASRDGFSALVESEAVLAIVDRYNDGLHGPATRPLIADPQNVELNRAQLSYARKGLGSVTVGRQRIDLADQRFVASAPFRQSEQTFDAVRVQWVGAGAGVSKLTADVTYAWQVHTIWGVDGRGARQPAVDGDNLFALVGYRTPVGTLTGFTYLVDQDEAAVQAFRLSSQTYGARLAGSVGGAVKLGYVASWARQSDWHRNPNRYAADYRLGEATLSRRTLSATAGYEALGADRGIALTSFQAPLSALFKFQGWADRFTTTPPDGIRDYYAGAGWKPGAVALTGSYHHFTSDRALRPYGDEIDLLATLRRGRALYAARLAHYRADRFGADTDKVWLSVDWSL